MTRTGSTTMFKNLAIAGTAAMSLALMQLPASAAEILFGTSGAGGSASSLYTIDTGTGVATLVGPIGFSHVVSIDFDPLTGVLYGIENNGNTLITIDTATGVGTSTGVTVTGISQSPDMSFDSAGTLYTWSEPSPDHLNTVDLITGVTTDVGPSGLSTARLGLDVDSTDTIYVKNCGGGIYTVSATTGATTLVVGIGFSLGDNALAFDAADTLYTLDRTGIDSDLYTIDLTTGATTLIGSTGIASMAALAFGGDNCFVIDAIDDQGSVINDGTTADFLVLANDECSGDTPISVVELPGDLQPDRGGSATTDGTTVNYRPAAGFVGFEEFTYTAQDAGLDGGDDPPTVDQDTATVVVNVLEDITPDAVDDEATTLQNQATIIDVLENDSLGNVPSNVEIETAPANGSATVQADDTIRYVPNFDFFGEDSFEYRLTDANGDSDVATVTVGVFFVSGQVPIDIMPNDAGNNINLRAGPGAGIRVAILSVGEFFEAPELIDPLTLKLGPRQANIWGTARVRDVDKDGDDDLLVKFLTHQTGIACGDTQASLSGRTFAFQSISGTDAINTFNCPRVRKRY